MLGQATWKHFILLLCQQHENVAKFYARASNLETLHIAAAARNMKMWPHFTLTDKTVP
jgi:hypothetical protein